MGKTRRGNRSPKAAMRRRLSHFVNQAAHKDLTGPKEDVNLMSKGACFMFLDATYPEVDLEYKAELMDTYEKGEVLSDPRGQGSHQQIEVQ